MLENYNTGRMRIVLSCFVVPGDKSSMMRGSVSHADLKLSEAALHENSVVNPNTTWLEKGLAYYSYAALK